jgi:hypothetical protein
MGEKTCISILYRIEQGNVLNCSHTRNHIHSPSTCHCQASSAAFKGTYGVTRCSRTRRVTGIDGPDLQVQRQTVRQVPSIQTLLSVPPYRIADDFGIVEGVSMHFMRSSVEIHFRRCSVDVSRRKSAPLSRSPLNRSRQPDRSFRPTINTIDHRNYWLLSRITFVFRHFR